MTARVRPDWSGRLDLLQSSLPVRALDALVVSTPVNATYLTGFDGSSQLLLLTREERLLITDGRYAFAVRDGVEAGTLAAVTLERVDKRYDLTLGAVTARRKLRRVGFEAAHVTVATLRAWERADPDVEWIPTERVVEKQRMVKDAGELEIFHRAGRLLTTAARELGPLVVRGHTEREVANAIDATLRRVGFARPAFPTIVASGPNSAHPHAHPSERRLTDGDLVVLDFGGVLDGYCVDLTRMAAIGQLASGATALYDAVRDAHTAAVMAVRPGIETSAIDAAARTVLETRGLGDAFLHATGHGLGLEVHEAPRIARADPDTTDRTEVGMVFTIEPGAYVEGVGGVRLEDDVLVTAEGCEVLTDMPRDLLVV